MEAYHKDKLDKAIDDLQAVIIEEENALLEEKPFTSQHHIRLDQLESVLYKVGSLHSRSDGPMMTTAETVEG